jgi:ATPase subunit of ABC transporter with duplicated ATPase domains
LVLEKQHEFIVEKGSKVGLVGPNGAGKSVFLEILSEYEGPRTKIRLVRQQDDKLPLQQTPVSLIDTEKFKQPRAVLAKWKLSPHTHMLPISSLSGGEKKKLSLMRTILESPNILLLDEPTNHMDMDSVDTLISNLNDYQGGLVVSSHNKHFLRSVCHELWQVKDGMISRFHGTIDDYVQQVKEELGIVE